MVDVWTVLNVNTGLVLYLDPTRSDNQILIHVSGFLSVGPGQLQQQQQTGMLMNVGQVPLQMAGQVTLTLSAF